jgi:hypothetical protein
MDFDVVTNGVGISIAQTAQYYRAPREGLYEEIPIRGILYMNSHAFNLTSKETQIHTWTNLFYAKSRKNQVKTIAVFDDISNAFGQAPVTKQTLCSTWPGAESRRLGAYTGIACFSCTARVRARRGALLAGSWK